MSAKRAYSDEGHRHSPERYSDDFVSDDEDKMTQKHKRAPTSRKNSSHQYYQEKFFGRGSGSLKNQVQGYGKKGRGNGRGDSLSSEPADMKKNNDSVATRVMSASRNRINELRNTIEEMKIRIRELEQENKLFKTTQFRQEKAIKSFSDKENDLPLILEKHNNEIRALKEQNRRLKEKFDKSDRYLRDAEDELERVKKKMNKYKEICENKELMERDELSRKLTMAQQEVEESEIKMKELQRHVEVLKKSHKHELGIEFARQKDLRKQLEELKEKYSQLGNQLKQKDKALDYQNIHSNPNLRKLPRNHSPDSALTWKTKRKTSSMTELTPREKAKFYSEKQRTELYKQKEALQKRSSDRLLGEDKEKKDKQVKRDQKELQEMKTREREDYENTENKIDEEKLEEERRHQHENLESDTFLQEEERKNKDELLKKLKPMNEPFHQSLPDKISEDKTNEYDELHDSNFVKHSDNLHPTKPFYQDSVSRHLELQKNKRQSSSDDAVGYKPSFGLTRENINRPSNKPTPVFDDEDDEPAFKINKEPTNTAAPKNDKKPNLLESLFGPQSNSSKNLSTKKIQENDNFFISDETPHINNQLTTANSTFPWETKPDYTKSSKSTFHSDSKSALFSINTLESSNKVSSVPQRQHNSNVISAKPSVTAFDNFNDDIEEVIL